MSVSVEDVCTYIESFAPTSWAESWDNVGLQIGSLKAKVKHLGLALELCPEVVDWLFDEDIDCLLTHHPVFFKPLKALREEDPWEGLIVRLVRDGKTVVSYHTNLDVAPGGVTEVLAEALGLFCEGPVRPVSPEFPGVGMGRVGRLSVPARVSDIARRLSRIIAAPVFLIGADREVEKVALCAGAGADLLPQVLQTGAEVYITGEVKHHTARRAELAGLSLVVTDHYAMEAYYLKILRERLEIRFSGLKISLFEGQSPFRLVRT